VFQRASQMRAAPRILFTVIDLQTTLRTNSFVPIRLQTARRAPLIFSAAFNRRAPRAEQGESKREQKPRLIPRVGLVSFPNFLFAAPQGLRRDAWFRFFATAEAES